MEDQMGDGFKGFMFGFGVTAGAIIGIYAGFKGIEMIGYYGAKRDEQKEFEARVNAEVERRVVKAA
jgi:hypothetical protein